jgi:2-amino-4-hydroxy-6-hydroxymethyldihydropteridine diphosphokinase
LKFLSAEDLADLAPDDLAVVALGSNLAGEYASSEALLEAALAAFPQAGLPVLARSRWWSSAAWPDPNGPEYRNGVALVEAKGAPRDLLNALLTIETHLGRSRAEKNAPRTLDLDLIAFGRAVVDDSDLTIPHPRAHDRLFVMGPLAEIAPGWVHPLIGKTAVQLANEATVGLDSTPL